MTALVSIMQKTNSNTTLVKVKYLHSVQGQTAENHSNTTLVKVK